MYLDYYRLSERPFNVTSDPAFLYLSKRHKEAFTHLIYGIKERKGFLEITGEVGTGKTTLCRALLNQLDPQTKAAFIFNSDLSELQVLQAIADDLNINVERRTKMELFAKLNLFLIHQLRAGNNVVLILDEAQNLKARTLEQLRMLSNLETDKEKLFQIILVGQPELREKLNSPNLRQLRQRISVRYHILPLEQNEITDYVNHRLSIAGSDGTLKFTEDAIEKIYEYSGGIPRLINIVCDKSLLLGFVLERYEINGNIIEKSIEEIEGRIAV
ncbi:MAG: XrtA-associated ATPase [Candidatus Omnitrophica bacterium]|nr:XrtA-associated ATPase [Candidatus Omnitrophota bacterium]MBU4488892.1 XrtA-associated ATPase [Candidatus Omnitrophota bacterium]MCG2705480.1 XrtA-associated ATPase [Candidatus Omnitrophota bacterium]